jgi:hypothetical protein
VAFRTTATLNGARGMAKLTVKPRATTYYRWTFSGTSASLPSHSAARMLKVLR